MPKPSAEEIAARRAEAAARKALKEEQQATVEDTPLFLMVHDTEEYSFEYGEVDADRASLTLVGTTKELGEGYDVGNTGLTVWAGAKTLAEYIWQHRREAGGGYEPHQQGFAGKSLCELGCGLGLVGMVAAKAGTFGPICITDGDEDTVNLLELNLGKNGLKPEFGSQLLWGEDEEAEEAINRCLGDPSERFDLVVAADVVYEDECVAPLLNTVVRLLKNSGSFIMAYTSRVVPFSRVEEEARSRGLRWADTGFECHESFDNGELRKYKLLDFTFEDGAGAAAAAAATAGQ